MKDLLMTPEVMGAIGVIVVGFVLLILAVRALRKSSKPKPIKEFDFPALTNHEPLSVVSPDSNPFSTPAASPAPAPVANKEVLNKVDLISQRLVDMQMLLNKQVSASAAQGAGSNAGLSPDMLDKLLKITATVAQQIEVLQKALGGTPTAPAAPHPPASGMIPVDMGPPVNAPRSTPIMTPVSQAIKTPPTPQ
jgi:hypothetical protein